MEVFLFSSFLITNFLLQMSHEFLYSLDITLENGFKFPRSFGTFKIHEYQLYPRFSSEVNANFVVIQVLVYVPTIRLQRID